MDADSFVDYGSGFLRKSCDRWGQGTLCGGVGCSPRMIVCDCATAACGDTPFTGFGCVGCFGALDLNKLPGRNVCVRLKAEFLQTDIACVRCA